MKKKHRLRYRITCQVTGAMQVFYLIVILLMLSCSKPQLSNFREGAEEIVIDVKNPTAISLDSMINRVEYIKLETTDESLFKSVSQILFVDSFIVISDQSVVRVFDLSGKFIRSLGHRGQGPGEYIDVDYLTVDPADNSLTIFDRGLAREIHYNITDSTFMYTKRRPFYADNFEYLISGLKAYNCLSIPDPKLRKYKNSLLVVTDRDNNIIYGDFEKYYKENIWEYRMLKALYRFGNEVYFSPDFSNMIYQITDSMVIPKYYLNIAWNGMPPIDRTITNEIMGDYFKRYFVFNGEFIELKDFSYINVSVPDASDSFVIYSHLRKKTYFTNLDGSHPLFIFIRNAPIARYQDNAVVFEVAPRHLLMGKEDLYKYFGNYKSLLDDLFTGLDEESNSILVICHLNKDM